MFKIPLSFVNLTVFPDHGWRFGMFKAFYITFDGTNATKVPLYESSLTDLIIYCSYMSVVTRRLTLNQPRMF